MCVAQFVRFYGNTTFDNGRITWDFFWLLFMHMPKLIAQQQVVDSTSVAMGVGLVMNKDAAADLDRFRREAYDPEL